MKSENSNIKRNTLRRIAALAMLLMAFTVSAEAQESYYCPNCKTEIFIATNKTIINRRLNNIHYFGNCTSGLEINGICMECNKRVLRTKIDPIPHDWGDATHVDPTCTENGGDRHTCNRCGATETYNEVAALGHLWGSPFDYVAPTCTTAGGYHHTCQRDGCGVTELDNRDPALGHEWGEWSTVAPTCTEQGYDWRLCTRCDAVDISNYVDPLGHTWGADYRCIRGDAELPAIAYVKADGTEGSHQAIPITGGEDDDVVMGFGSGDMWYYLSGNVTLKSLRLIDRTANIILTAGCKNTILGGINAENGSLNIYTQSNRGILNSAINAHGDVHIHGGYVNAFNSSVGGDLVLGWTNTNDQFHSSSISAGGTITIAEGKALINATNESEIFYGDGTAIDVANISGKILDPKTDVLCYVGADDHAHFLNEGDYTVLTNETVINPENSSADAVQWLVVSGNVEFTGDLSLCGTTHLILLDDAVLTASSTSGYALYTERVTNIYGSTKGNGRIEVPNGDLYAGGLLNIYSGDIRVSGSFKGRGTKNFSWTRPNNSIYANNYENSAPNLTKAFTDGTKIYYGSLTADELTAIAGKTLTPCVIIAGDVNGNGEVDIDDAVSILRHLVNKPNEKFIEAAAKLNDNDEIDIDDAVEILKFLVGKIPALSRAKAPDPACDKAPDPDPTESDPD